MKIYFKTSAIIILSLLFTNCRKESTSYLQRAYEEAVKLHQEGNLNDAVFYYQLTALNCQYHPEDSLTYWWKAMCGQGEVWRQKNFLVPRLILKLSCKMPLNTGLTRLNTLQAAN